MTRLAFLGSPPVAADVLRALVAAGHEVRLVVTMPDKRRSRGSRPVPTAVKAAAVELGVPVSERVADVVGAGADLGVVVAFGRIVKPEVLEALAMVNLHFSLLPRWRGAAPVERAILAGDEETGVCLMALEAGLDTGPLYGCSRTPIGEDETAEELRGRLGALGTRLLVEQLAGGLGEATPQVGSPTYAEKLRSEELVLDWHQSALALGRVVRVGRASTTFRGERLLVHRARPVRGACLPGGGPPGTLAGPLVGTGDGTIELVEVQAAGRARQGFADWARGARPRAGERLG